MTSFPFATVLCQRLAASLFAAFWYGSLVRQQMSACSTPYGIIVLHLPSFVVLWSVTADRAIRWCFYAQSDTDSLGLQHGDSHRSAGCLNNDYLSKRP